MRSVITEEILRRIGARLSRVINRNEKKTTPLPKHITSTKINQVTETPNDTADFAFVGNHEPQFIAE